MILIQPNVHVTKQIEVDLYTGIQDYAFGSVHVKIGVWPKLYLQLLFPPGRP